MNEWTPCEQLPGWQIKVDQFYNRRWFSVQLWNGEDGELAKRSTEVIPLKAGTAEAAIRKALPQLARWARDQ